MISKKLRKHLYFIKFFKENTTKQMYNIIIKVKEL